MRPDGFIKKTVHKKTDHHPQAVGHGVVEGLPEGFGIIRRKAVDKENTGHVERAIGHGMQQLGRQDGPRGAHRGEQQPAQNGHGKREEQDLFERKAFEKNIRADHHYDFGAGGQRPGGADESAPKAKLSQVNGKKTVVGAVADQHQKRAQEKNQGLLAGRKAGTKGRGQLLAPAGSRHQQRYQRLQEGTRQNQVKNHADRKKVDNFSQHQHRQDEADGAPGADFTVSLFSGSEDLHGEGFQKGDQRRKKNSVAHGYGQHEVKVGGEEKQPPEGHAGKLAEDENRPAAVVAVCQNAPDQRKDNRNHRPQRRQDPDLHPAEADAVAVEVKERQKNTQHPEVEEVLRADYPSQRTGL